MGRVRACAVTSSPGGACVRVVLHDRPNPHGRWVPRGCSLLPLRLPLAESRCRLGAGERVASLRGAMVECPGPSPGCSRGCGAWRDQFVAERVTRSVSCSGVRYVMRPRSSLTDESIPGCCGSCQEGSLSGRKELPDIPVDQGGLLVDDPMRAIRDAFDGQVGNKLFQPV